MKTIQIFDPALCCSSGVCGPETDPALVAFAADLSGPERRASILSVQSGAATIALRTERNR